MATRLILTPYSAEFGTVNFAVLSKTNQRPVLTFDAATDWACWWTFIAPRGWTGTGTAYVSYIMASATSGSVFWEGGFEAITYGDTAPDLDAATSFATTNTAGTVVPGTAGLLIQQPIPMTNDDSVTAGDYVRFQLNRDANHASDSAAGNALLLVVELVDAS